MSLLASPVPGDVILSVQAGASVYMAGLCWFVQTVHYPLMARVGADEFVEYEREHQRRTSLATAPCMIVEAACAGLAVLWCLGVVELFGTPPPTWLAWTGLALVIGLWVSTFAVQIPMHVRLARGRDARAIRRLVATNWVRTLLWSARGVVALAMLAGHA